MTASHLRTVKLKALAWVEAKRPTLMKPARQIDRGTPEPRKASMSVRSMSA